MGMSACKVEKWMNRRASNSANNWLICVSCPRICFDFLLYILLSARVCMFLNSSSKMADLLLFLRADNSENEC